MYHAEDLDCSVQVFHEACIFRYAKHAKRANRVNYHLCIFFNSVINMKLRKSCKDGAVFWHMSLHKK